VLDNRVVVGVDANAAQYTQHMPVSDDDLY
jgi:hypothetical protein